MLHAWDSPRNSRCTRHHFVAALQVRAVWQLRGNDNVALILLRNETGRDAREAQIGKTDKPAVEQQHDKTHPQNQSDGATIAVHCSIKNPIEPRENFSDSPVDSRTEHPSHDTAHQEDESRYHPRGEEAGSLDTRDP